VFDLWGNSGCAIATVNVNTNIIVINDDNVIFLCLVDMHTTPVN